MAKDNKKRVSSDIETHVVEQMDAAAAKLEMSRSGYIEMSVTAELNRFDAREALKKKQEFANEAVKDANQARTERDEARKERDHFKANFETKCEELAVADTKLKAYEGQSWWSKVFGRKPKFDTLSIKDAV